MRRAAPWLARLAGVTALLLTVVIVICIPQPLFAHTMRYQNFDVWSDQEISPQLESVLDDANRRLRTSTLYRPEDRYKLFLCNAPWRLWLYGGHFSTRVGGFADTVATRNIYIRAADLPANRVLMAPGMALADAAHRPLSYFIAHEAAHIMESRRFGRLMYLRNPVWLSEGYADRVGKAGDFDFAENLQLFKLRTALLDPKRSGLYRRYQLEVDYLLAAPDARVEQLFAQAPPEDALLEQLRATPGPR
ncbi:MAG: hypothetical protein V4582_16715 [Pseudomonadota bacterium]